ncbi:hypothetical protein SAMN05216332_11614 [Nitrosospira briensis]|nr:hypothetical protein SAMN05216332_11614 [Nitrosospira briensis]
MFRRIIASQVRTFFPDAISSAATDQVNRAQGRNVQTGPPTLGGAYAAIATAVAENVMSRFAGSHTEAQRVAVAQTSVGLPASQALHVVRGNYQRWAPPSLNALRVRKMISPAEHSAMQSARVSMDPNFANSVQNPNEDYFAAPDTYESEIKRMANIEIS